MCALQPPCWPILSCSLNLNFDFDDEDTAMAHDHTFVTHKRLINDQIELALTRGEDVSVKGIAEAIFQESGIHVAESLVLKTIERYWPKNGPILNRPFNKKCPPYFFLVYASGMGFWNSIPSPDG